MRYIVEFTHDNDSVKLFESNDKNKAIETGKQKQAELQAAGKNGIISLYEITTDKGCPMRKCYEFWEVK